MTDANDTISDEMVTAAMRAFEPFAARLLRYPEKDRWHLNDIHGMREAIKAAFAIRNATRAVTAPSEEEIRKAMCCPMGCIRGDDCWSRQSRYVPPDRVVAIMALLARKSPVNGDQAALMALRAEMIADTDRHGCSRCWSDDLQLPCTCQAERSTIRMTIHTIFNRLMAQGATLPSG